MTSVSRFILGQRVTSHAGNSFPYDSSGPWSSLAGNPDAGGARPGWRVRRHDAYLRPVKIIQGPSGVDSGGWNGGIASHRPVRLPKDPGVAWVSFADLDLRKHADVTELETRIETTAKETCESLDEMFPITGSAKDEIRRCTKRAIKGADEQLQAAISAAAPVS